MLCNIIINIVIDTIWLNCCFDVISCLKSYLYHLEVIVSYPLNADEAVYGYVHSVQLPLAVDHPMRFHCKFLTFFSHLKSYLQFQLLVYPQPIVLDSVKKKEKKRKEIEENFKLNIKEITKYTNRI